MVFSSVLFLFYFLPITMALYYIMPRGARNGVLFFASLFFYAWGEPRYVLIMLFSTVVDYSHGRLIEKYRHRPKLAKAFLISSLVINLSVLGFFKYYNFLAGSVLSLLGFSLPSLQVVLPIGISFYTFQTMSYTIDVYWDRAKVQHNIIHFGAFVTLFPQLIAGPIVRYTDIAEELDDKNRESLSKFYLGVRRFLLGLGKKVLLANNIGILWDVLCNQPLGELSVFTAWLGMIAFALQIYFDFSGYSDMAIGLGLMLGFTFPENFNYPYISKSITEFWRRWHMSLGSWFREYVYIPLGGNRVGLPKQIRNILIVWLLTGFWHGAGWNFILWGLYFGALLLIEKSCLLEQMKKWPSWLQHSYTMILVLIGWTIFSFEQIGEIGQYLSAMFGLNGQGLFDAVGLYQWGLYWPILLLGGLASTPFWKKLSLLQEKKPLLQIIFSLGLAFALILSTAYLVDASYNPFLYFRF